MGCDRRETYSFTSWLPRNATRRAFGIVEIRGPQLVQIEQCGRSLPSKRIQPVGGCA